MEYIPPTGNIYQNNIVQQAKTQEQQLVDRSFKNSLNAHEVTTDGENRVLKLISREMHQQGVIHWFCKKKYKE